MKTPLPPESLESRIAPAAVSGLGDDFAGPLPTGLPMATPPEAAPPTLTVDEAVFAPRSGNIDLGTIVPDITTVPLSDSVLGDLSAAASAAVLGSASTLNILATSALGVETGVVSKLGISEEDGTTSAIDTTSALQSGAADIADLVLVKSGGFAGANPESLLIVKV